MTGAEPALRLLGLAARAGAVVWGTERVREAARGGRLRLVLIARDASANSRDKLVPLLEARQIRHRAVLDQDRLGDALGRGPLSAVGIDDAGLARRIEELLGQAGLD
jgi:ribosomal protein L7Ae-like RNA K-turn-binding protein